MTKIRLDTQVQGKLPAGSLYDGNETINGNKTFSGVTNINTTETFKDLNVGGNTSGNMGISIQNKGAGGAQLSFRNSAGIEKYAETYIQSEHKVLFYNGASDFMALDLTNGRLGIGTTSPGQNLDVIGNFNFEDASGRVDGCYGGGRVLNVSTTVAGTGRDAFFINSIGGGDSRGLIVHDNSSDNSTNALANIALGNGAANRVAFRVDNNGLGPNSVFLGGNVGIGTSSPSYKLDVTGDINSTTDVKVGGVSLKLIPQNSQSANYTLALTDSGKHIYHPSADTTARTWTIPANSSVAFPIGTAITMINDTSGGNITIAITTDTLVQAGTGSTGSRTLAANGSATIIKVTSTRWQINGVNLT